MTPALHLQQVIRLRLVTDPDVTALVPAGHIVDGQARPAAFPCILIGEGQEIRADEVARRYFSTVATLHLWHRGEGLAGVKALAGPVRRAVVDAGPWSTAGYRCHDLRFGGSRFFLDRDGQTAHGVVTIEALLEERPQ